MMQMQTQMMKNVLSMNGQMSKNVSHALSPLRAEIPESIEASDQRATALRQELREEASKAEEGILQLGPFIEAEDDMSQEPQEPPPPPSHSRAPALTHHRCCT